MEALWPPIETAQHKEPEAQDIGKVPTFRLAAKKLTAAGGPTARERLPVMAAMMPLSTAARNSSSIHSDCTLSPADAVGLSLLLQAHTEQ